MLGTTDGGFTLHGEPFRLVAGALHYMRVHPGQWADRLRKARLLGLNTIDVYLPWNLHEPEPGRLDLAGLPEFLDLVAAEGLYVLLRPGPYICAEWDGGGLPAWLLAEPGIRLRSTDPLFMDPLADYFEQLWPHLRPYLASRGGPVLAVQVENEYGAFGSDTEYLAAVADLLRHNGVDVPLFTCDQPGDLHRGLLPGVLATVTFGSRAAQGLAALRALRPDGPQLCSEFWDGWFDRWGGIHRTRSAADAAATLADLLAEGASVNLYMFHGGTNFGFTSGANDKGTYHPTVTSYDYDAPLDEAGDATAKYHAFREVLARYVPVPDEPVPGPGPKLAVPEVALAETVALFDSLDVLSVGKDFPAPPSMEELGQASGFTLYETTLGTTGPVTLELTAYGDRVQAFVDGQPVGVLSRENHERALRCRGGGVLRLLVENQGRVNYGQGIHDRKGLLGPVRANGAELTGWRAYPLPLTDLSGLAFGSAGEGPLFHRGHFEVDEPADTFLALPGWTKGVAWVNGLNLGRYWSRGPQRTLYVPGPALRPGRNELLVLELHGTRAPVAELRAEPDLGETEE
ncbi:beta-galactosidase [Crossiella equi]|uniref:Beta-galactosidase n=1 Tax=Crossiella equi TaxID=130796 RepID=A0ABS5APB5_9PSEU|nr:beta-galactosidase family protein [Crossiella equi]MBP2478385.1 beta-galactosidase [Crossiella equi]